MKIMLNYFHHNVTLYFMHYYVFKTKNKGYLMKHRLGNKPNHALPVHRPACKTVKDVPFSHSATSRLHLLG